MNTNESFERLVIAGLAGDGCPTSDQLAGYTLGLLTGNEQLAVAAHVRSCPLCQTLVEISRPPEPERQSEPGGQLLKGFQTLVAQLITPLPALNRRSDANREHIRQYMVADIAIELLIPPPHGESWSITGQVLQGGVGLALCDVRLQVGRRKFTQTSDADGFFAFADLSSGQYQLSVTHAQVRVEINDLTLYEDNIG
jgi:hypothetical protein